MLAVSSDLWWKAFLGLAVSSGLRKSELLNLLWQDIDFDRGTVRVAAKRPGAFLVHERGEFRILEWTAKSYTERTVPLPSETIDLLRPISAPSR